MASHSQGYTIIEVSLFLAITGLLFIIALFGTGNALQTTRFSDTGRTTHAYLQKQYDNLFNGVNTRPGQEECNASNVDTLASQSPGTSNCLSLGKAIFFKIGSTVLTTYDVVGTEPANPNYNLSDTDLIKSFSPKLVRNVSVDTFQIPWQATIIGGKRPVDNVSTDVFMLIRSPRSTHVVSYTFKESDLRPDPNDMSPVLIDANTSQLTNFCLKSADNSSKIAKIVITGDQGQDSIQLGFDANAGDCS
ncbi:MAG TPA: hypothetical protein VNX65_01945 [Patescibacteria group bacterium]|jgi:hypothetical protein|nr:hypothetical protein [Patescibacteria group bacterium]